MYLWTSVNEKIDCSGKEIKECIEKYIARNPEMSQVALMDGKIVGTVLAGHDGRRGFIHHMAVMPEYRRHGIGKEMAKIAISKIEEDGIDKTHIFCYQNNETGQSFWKTLGFVKRDDVFVYSLSKNKE